MAEATNSRFNWQYIALQITGTVAVVGIPLGIWATNVNSNMAVMTSRIEAQERLANDFKTYQTGWTNQMIDINRQLSAIAIEIRDIREQTKTRK